MEIRDMGVRKTVGSNRRRHYLRKIAEVSPSPMNCSALGRRVTALALPAAGKPAENGRQRLLRLDFVCDYLIPREFLFLAQEIIHRKRDEVVR